MSMSNREIMEHISEALCNLSDGYPAGSKALANRAFGHLMGHFDWHPSIMTILKEDGSIRQEFVYKVEVS